MKRYNSKIIKGFFKKSTFIMVIMVFSVSVLVGCLKNTTQNITSSSTKQNSKHLTKEQVKSLSDKQIIDKAKEEKETISSDGIEDNDLKGLGDIFSEVDPIGNIPADINAKE